MGQFVTVSNLTSKGPYYRLERTCWIETRMYADSNHCILELPYWIKPEHAAMWLVTQYSYPGPGDWRPIRITSDFRSLQGTEIQFYFVEDE